MEINILENSCCIINLIIISKLVLGPGKNLESSGHQNGKRIAYFLLTHTAELIILIFYKYLRSVSVIIWNMTIPKPLYCQYSVLSLDLIAFLQ